MPEDKLTHWKTLTNNDYIGAYSLQPGEERVVEIISVGKEIVKGNDGREESCIVAKLKNEKPFILNKTNCKTLEKLFKTAFIEQWVNKKIIVYAENVKAFGEYVDALRIKPTQPSLPELSPESPKWVGAAEYIASGQVTIEAIEKQYFLSKKNKAVLLKLVPKK